MLRRIGSNLIAAVVMSALVGAAPSGSPVADAAMKGDVAAVRALLKEGADVNAARGDGMSALHWAAERGNGEMAGLLIYAGANVSAVTRIGQYTPLHVAARSASVVVDQLLKAGAVVDARAVPSGATALHLAATSGNPAVIVRLVDGGADANAKEAEWGQTPLIFAAAQNRVEAIKALIGRGADPNIASTFIDVPQRNALDRAASRLQGKVLESMGVGPERLPTASQMQAAVQASRDVFLSGKIPPPEKEDSENQGRGQNFNPEEINPPVQTKGGLTALLHASRQGHLDAARSLVDGGADVNRTGAGDGTSPLLMAVINGQFDMATLLLERGADPNVAAKNNGVTPLWAALNTQWQPRTRFPQPQEMERQKATYVDVMKAMLDKGADPNGRIKAHPWYMVYTGCGNRNCGLADTSGSTPFWRAAYSVDVEAMKLLVSYGADPNIATMAPAAPIRRGGANAPPAGAGGPIMPTARDGQERYTAPPIPPGGPGAFPIHAAAGVEYGEGFAGNAHRHAPDGWMPAMKYLVEVLGADVNARDNDGYTPLHHAAARGDNEMILYLVSKGADVAAVARSGQSTADMANGPVQRVSPYPETVSLLEKLGSRNNHNCMSC